MKKQRTISAHKKKAASLPRKVTLRQLPTAVRGLDEILGGGVPEYSFNIIAGAAGCGKTTLAHQIVFGNASEKCRALYFTVLAAADATDTDAQWLRAKTAANDAITAAGGTIPHHHAVGTAHRGHVQADLGG